MKMNMPLRTALLLGGFVIAFSNLGAEQAHRLLLPLVALSVILFSLSRLAEGIANRSNSAAFVLISPVLRDGRAIQVIDTALSRLGENRQSCSLEAWILQAIIEMALPGLDPAVKRGF